MIIETHETKLDTLEDAKVIAKRWYTEQRGRRLGNTVSWEDLSDYNRHLIIQRVLDTLFAFDVSMKPEPTPHEKRNNNAGTDH